MTVLTIALMLASSPPAYCPAVRLAVQKQIVCEIGDSSCPITPEIAEAVKRMHAGCMKEMQMPCARVYELDTKQILCGPEVPSEPASDKK